MNYELLTFACISLTLGIMIGYFLIKKRIPVISVILSILLIALMIMKKIDFEYYKQLLGNVSNMELYIFITSIVILFITFLEIVLKIFKKNKKNKDKKEDDMNNISDNNKSIIFHMLRSDMAYYDYKKEKYILNDHLKNTINANSYELSSLELNSFILSEDLQNLDSTNNGYINFRMNTNNGYEWFELINYKKDNEECKVIYRIDKKLNNNGLIGSYKDLEKAIQDLNKQSIQYGLVLTNIVSIKENNPITKLNYLNINKEIMAKDFRELVVTKYITGILSGYLKDQVKVYRLATSEYAFLILSKRSYEIVERGFFNNTSEFISCDLKVEKENVSIKSKAGVVFSGYIKERDDYKVINAAFDMLQMATSANYKQNYVLYQSPDENKPNYKLKDIGIDLDNDLNNYLHKND